MHRACCVILAESVSKKDSQPESNCTDAISIPKGMLIEYDRKYVPPCEAARWAVSAFRRIPNFVSVRFQFHLEICDSPLSIWEMLEWINTHPLISRTSLPAERRVGFSTSSRIPHRGR